VPTPMTRDRFAGPTALTMAAMANVKAEQAMPRPVRTPPVSCSANALSEADMPQMPNAYITAPMTIALPVPCLSASAPAIGNLLY